METEKQNKSQASLRVISAEYPTSKITEILGLKPSSTVEKGTPFSRRNPDSKLRTHSGWHLDSTIDESEPLQDHIEELIRTIERNEERFSQLKGHCETDLFCGFFAHKSQGGFTLSASLVQRMASHGLRMILEYYGPDQEE